MLNRLQKQPVVTYTVGQPALPARPPYCYKQRVSSSDGRSGSGSYPGSTSVTVATPGSSQSSVSGNNGGIVYVNHSYGGTPNRPKPRYVTVCYGGYPAQEGIPARINYEDMNGWNGGARSIKPVPVGSYFDVSIPADAVGVMVGLSDGAFNHSYQHASHAMVARPAGVTPVERGVTVGAVAALGTTLRMIRDADGVRMLVDGELIYSSPNPVAGKAYLDATLYAASDYAFDPVIGQYIQAVGECSAGVSAAFSTKPRGAAQAGVSAIGRVSVDGVYRVGGVAKAASRPVGQAISSYRIAADSHISAFGQATAYTAVSPGGASGHKSNYCAASLGLTAAGTDSVTVVGSMAAGLGLQLTAMGGTPEAEINQFACNLPAPQLTALGVVIVEGSLSAQLGVLGAGADGDYAGVNTTAAIGYAVSAWEPYLPGDTADVAEPLYAADTFVLDTIVLLAIQEEVGISDEIDIYLLIDVSLYETLMATDTISLASTIDLLMREQVSINSRVGQAQTEALQYAVNAVTGALSTYRNFGFKQFATVQGVTYGITDTGLYRLQGNTDDGDTLNALIDFGATDFGTAQAKRLSYVYAGLATDGEVYLRLTGDDGEERVYRAVGGANEKRATTAKGIAARHWRLRLELVDACYGDLDNIEIMLGASQRRLR